MLPVLGSRTLEWVLTQEILSQTCISIGSGSQLAQPAIFESQGVCRLALLDVLSTNQAALFFMKPPPGLQPLDFDLAAKNPCVSWPY